VGGEDFSASPEEIHRFYISMDCVEVSEKDWNSENFAARVDALSDQLARKRKLSVLLPCLIQDDDEISSESLGLPPAVKRMMWEADEAASHPVRKSVKIDETASVEECPFSSMRANSPGGPTSAAAINSQKATGCQGGNLVTDAKLVLPSYQIRAALLHLVLPLSDDKTAVEMASRILREEANVPRLLRLLPQVLVGLRNSPSANPFEPYEGYIHLFIKSHVVRAAGSWFTIKQLAEHMAKWAGSNTAPKDCLLPTMLENRKKEFREFVRDRFHFVMDDTMHGIWRIRGWSLMPYVLKEWEKTQLSANRHVL
jgi:hypothetical protein